MVSKDDLCKRVVDIQGVQAVFLVNDGSIVHWKAKRGAKMPPAEHIDNILVRRHMILALAGMHEGFLGKFHYNLSRYEESDVLLFDASMGKKSMLMVILKKPYELDAVVHEVRNMVKKS